MPDLGKAYVQIVPSANGISDSIGKTIAPGAQKAGVGAGKSIASGIGSSMQKLGGNMMKAGAIATAVAVPIVAGIKSALGAYEVQTAAETKLTEIYKTRMGATEEAAKATMEYASALQQEGVIGDEVMLSGAQQVATFAKMPETVNTLLPAMNNLLAQQKGYNATAEDATGIANLMGKALNGQTGALTRVGISFDETQEKILKTGTEEEKAAVLAQVITDNVGNMNETLADTPLGKIQQMKNTLGDLQEELGAQLAPVIQQIAEFVSAKVVPAVQKVMDFLGSNPIIAKIVIGLTGLLAVGGPLLIIIGSIVSAVGALIPVVTAISAPVVAIVAGIGALVAVLIAAYNQSESFRVAVNSLVMSVGQALMPIIDMTVQFFKELVAEITITVTEIANQLAPVISALTPVLTALAGILSGVLKSALTVIMGHFKVLGAVVRLVAVVFRTVFLAVFTIISGAVGKIRNFVTKIKATFSFSDLVGKVSGVFNRIKDKIMSPIQSARNKIKSIVDAIKGFFNFSVKTPHIPLPHFSIKPAGWKVGDLVKGKIPSLGVSWHAKGGLVNNATLIGAGESGPEAILPLDPFWKKLEQREGIDYDKLALAVLDAFQNANLTVETVVDGKVIARSTAPYMRKELDNVDRRAGRSLGIVGV